MSGSTRGWALVAGLLALPGLLPLGVVLGSLGRPDPQLWAHLHSVVLPQVLPTTLGLLLGVGLGVSLLGTLLAALVGLCEFPGRRLFQGALLLPLAFPGYVLATVFIGQLDYSGALASWLRAQGWVLPEVRGLGGAITVLVLALYPYVYLVALSAFRDQAARGLEAAVSLGHTPLSALRRVALPLALPAILAGTLLALMETLADFGTVAAFNVDTFTTAIYKAWFALYSLDTALQLAGVLLLGVIGLLLLEARLRGRRGYQQGGARAPRRQLRGAAALAASLACTGVLLLAAGLPLLQLLAWSLDWAGREWDARYGERLLNALLLAALAALVTVAAALLLALAQRRAPSLWVRGCARLATLGYAYPGALLAIGLFVPAAAASRWLAEAFDLRWVIGGSLGLMLLAYGIRFLAVAQAPVDTALLRLRPSLEEAARLHGLSRWARLRRVQLPLLSGGMLAALALVFVDVMKEMPITLMTRPFGWDTLAVRVFELTSEGELQRAALPCLVIVLAGLLPVAVLIRQLGREERGR